MRKVHIRVTLDLFVKMDDELTVSELLPGLQISAKAPYVNGAEIEDVTIVECEVTDSR